VYYALRRCSDLSTGWRTQQEITEISLSVNDRVEGSGPTTYIVTGTTTSGTNIGIVSDTGLTGCPEPVTTTTTISYNYYYAQPCGGGTTVTMRSVTAFSNGESFKFAGDSTCYEVVASGAPVNNNDWSEAFPDCSACLPPPTTPPPTTTTTIQPVFYALRRCSDLSSGWRTQQEITEISLSVNDRVEGSGPTIYIVTGTTTSGTNIGIVSDTGLTGCPEPVTTTTTLGYNYYYAQPCGGGTTVTMRSVTAFSNGESFKFTGDSTCYEVIASGAPANNNDWSEAFPDCSACLPPPTTTSTTVATTTSTTIDPYNYYAVRGCPDTFYENRDMYIRTTSTLPDANGNPSTSSTISWNGQSFYAYSTINASTWLSGSGDLASITYTGSVGVGCPSATTTTAAPTTQPPATTTTQPITTQAPTTTTVAPTTIPTTSTTAAPTTTTAAPTTVPATTTTQAPVTTTTAAPTTTTTTTAAPVVYEVAVTSGQSISDDACSLFAFTPLWSIATTPENGTRYYTDSGLNNEFNGGDQWYGFDLDGNGVTVSARITSFGYLYSTTECTGGGGFP
jgi:hypothetical protein